jgi:hypothetical protein
MMKASGVSHHECLPDTALGNAKESRETSEAIPPRTRPAANAEVTRSPGDVTPLGLRRSESALQLQHRITTTAACNRTSD